VAFHLIVATAYINVLSVRTLNKTSFLPLSCLFRLYIAALPQFVYTGPYQIALANTTRHIWYSSQNGDFQQRLWRRKMAHHASSQISAG
jgi:hypothetical protein